MDSRFRAPFVAFVGERAFPGATTLNSPSSTSATPPPAELAVQPASSPDRRRRSAFQNRPSSPLPKELVDQYPAPIDDSFGLRSVSFMVPTKCHLLAKPVGVANYMKHVATDKDRRKMHKVSSECVINAGMHAAAQPTFSVEMGSRE
ncbi:uncharacterized protein LOC132066907 [Lycium ferocissimum]|uniref:uncharacterized protein LOC132066907 n=1 Tax=Lycium ferocissimum TaxID=112874 RepID=UPI002814FB8A|nr:uncharacterized protein LOC132066907 [Lycium ferocissimum]